MILILTLPVTLFALAWWLGLYLVRMGEATSILRWIGIASFASSLLLASQVILLSWWAWLLVIVALCDVITGIFRARRNAAQWGEAFIPDSFFARLMQPFCSHCSSRHPSYSQ